MSKINFFFKYIINTISEKNRHMKDVIIRNTYIIFLGEKRTISFEFDRISV